LATSVKSTRRLKNFLIKIEGGSVVAASACSRRRGTGKKERWISYLLLPVAAVVWAALANVALGAVEMLGPERSELRPVPDASAPTVRGARRTRHSSARAKTVRTGDCGLQIRKADECGRSLAVSLSDQDVANLAACYASLSKLPSSNRTAGRRS
jgi:hypothetical protein